MRVVTEMKRGHGPWAKKVQTTEVIDLEKLFNDYWSSNAHKITVSGQFRCPSNLPAANREAQRPLSSERITDHLNYSSLPKLPFVCLQPHSQLAHNIRIGGIITLVTPGARGVVEEVLSTDECIDGEGLGHGY